jgi:hypothetical protein
MQIQFNAHVSNYFEGFRKIAAENATKIVALALVAIGVFAAALYKLCQSQTHKMAKQPQNGRDSREVKNQGIQNIEKQKSPKIQETPVTEKPKLEHMTKTRPLRKGQRPPTRNPRQKPTDQKV